MRRIVLALPLLLAIACKKDEAKPEPSGASEPKKTKAEPASAPKTDDDEPEAAKPAPKTKPSPNDGREIAGVGFVPAWGKDPASTQKCSGTKDTDATLKTIAKGQHDEIASGKADVDALARDLAHDCPKTKHHLADALNGGGFQHYKKKDWSTANRFWRAALVVSRAHALARFNLACGLALDGKSDDALWSLEELARAAKGGNVEAANLLEKAKSDDDLKSIRGDARFAKAIEAAPPAGLVGPRKEPETSKAAVALLPPEYHETDDPFDDAHGKVKHAPALVHVWTWRPEAGVELLVATLISDPANLGQPAGDMNVNYGGIVVLRRKGGKLELLHARKTSESPPSVAAGKGGTVAYTFYPVCTDQLRGSIAWKDGKVVVNEETCEGG